MSQSQTKKIRKEIRREVSKKFESGLSALADLTRERPRWIPKAIWILAYLPLFPTRYLKIIYKHLK